jgi:hypothetical protein
MYEQASERWSPVQSVEKVILSVISMLAGEGTPAFDLITFILKLVLIRPHFSPRRYYRRYIHRLFSAHGISHLPVLTEIFDTLYHTLVHATSWGAGSEPNLESGANIDCCKLYRDDRAVSVISLLAGPSSWVVYVPLPERFASFDNLKLDF